MHHTNVTSKVVWHLGVLSILLVIGSGQVHAVGAHEDADLSLGRGAPASSVERPAWFTRSADGPEPWQTAFSFEDDTLAGLSLEELMSIKVTSVSGVEMSWFTTPSAVYVIDREDLRRTGHRHWADALRMVPGMNVANLNSNAYAVSARGFNSLFANRLLVLVDGRTVYDPSFGGVYWQSQPFLFEDVDRIEVVRGPGATLWGANAVNGVINVTTLSARETQGLYLSGGAGSTERGFGQGRYGFQVADETYMRIWGSYRDVDNFPDHVGGNFPDAWDMTHGGLRLDHYVDRYHSTLDVGGFHSDRVGQRLLEPVPGGFFGTIVLTDRAYLAGAHALGRINYSGTEGDGWTLQGYYERFETRMVSGLASTRDSVDLDFRHHFQWMDRNELIWGLKYRLDMSTFDGAETVMLHPQSRSSHTISGFLQNTFTLVPDRLFVMVGSKFEHNDFTGFEYQPSARIWWTPDDKQTVWAAVSRSVRVPTRFETDGEFILGYMPSPPPLDRFVITGNPDLKSEKLFAYELGYRRRISETFWVDTSLFLNHYRDMVVFTPMLEYANDGKVDTYGVEVAARWQITPDWRLDGGYSLLQIRDFSFMGGIRGGAPRHQAHLRSMVDLTDDLEFNAAVYFTDRLTILDVPAYVRLDAGMTWRVTENLELSAWGQNLLDSKHLETVQFGVQEGAANVPRSFYVQATLRF